MSWAVLIWFQWRCYRLYTGTDIWGFKQITHKCFSRKFIFFPKILVTRSQDYMNNLKTGQLASFVPVIQEKGRRESRGKAFLIQSVKTSQSLLLLLLFVRKSLHPAHSEGRRICFIIWKTDMPKNLWKYFKPLQGVTQVLVTSRQGKNCSMIYLHEYIQNTLFLKGNIPTCEYLKYFCKTILYMSNTLACYSNFSIH